MFQLKNQKAKTKFENWGRFVIKICRDKPKKTQIGQRVREKTPSSPRNSPKKKGNSNIPSSHQERIYSTKESTTPNRRKQGILESNFGDIRSLGLKTDKTIRSRSE
jgi:hypothetical protein